MTTTRRQSTVAAARPAKATRREWIGLGILALPCLLYSMDLTVLNLAVPRLSADLMPTSAELLWIVDIYGFVLAGALITMGSIGDRIGRRRLLLIGAAAFGLASVAAAFSTSTSMLIAARALLGLAAATLAPSTLSLLRNMFHDPKERTFAVGVWIASFSAGGAIGPVVGGILLNYFWWGSVFLVAVPVMLVLLATGPFLLPEFRDPKAGRMDVAGAALSTGALLSMVYGIKRFAEHGFGWLPALAIAVGILIAAAFLRRQRRIRDPLLDLSLFGRPAFSASLAVNVVGFFVAFGSFLLVAQYLQLILGLSPLAAGLWSAPSGVAFIVSAMLTSTIAARIRPHYVMAGGLTVAMLGFLLLAGAVASRDLAMTVTAYALFSLGLGPVFTLTTDLIVGTAPPERAGMASGLAETSSELGGALGIAVLGSLVTAVYRGRMAAAVPDGVPDMLAETARDTLGGAATAANGLPGQAGLALLEIARGAFSDALIFAAAASAALALAAAIAALTLLRNAGPHPATAQEAASSASGS